MPRAQARAHRGEGARRERAGPVREPVREWAGPGEGAGRPVEGVRRPG